MINHLQVECSVLIPIRKNQKIGQNQNICLFSISWGGYVGRGLSNTKNGRKMWSCLSAIFYITKNLIKKHSFLSFADTVQPSTSAALPGIGTFQTASNFKPHATPSNMQFTDISSNTVPSPVAPFSPTVTVPATFRPLVETNTNGNVASNVAPNLATFRLSIESNIARNGVPSVASTITPSIPSCFVSCIVPNVASCTSPNTTPNITSDSTSLKPNASPVYTPGVAPGVVPNCEAVTTSNVAVDRTQNASTLTSNVSLSTSHNVSSSVISSIETVGTSTESSGFSSGVTRSTSSSASAPVRSSIASLPKSLPDILSVVASSLSTMVEAADTETVNPASPPTMVEIPVDPPPASTEAVDKSVKEGQRGTKGNGKCGSLPFSLVSCNFFPFCFV